jgi:hypothetical protein
MFLIFLCLILHCADKKSFDPFDDGNDTETQTTQFASDHFIFYFPAEARQTVQAARDSLESNYTRILNDLEVPEVPVITVRVWSDPDAFYEAMEQDIGTLYNGATGYILDLTEFRVLYPHVTPVEYVHEFAHVVSLYLNRRFANNPRWLWETVALYEARQFVHPNQLGYMVAGNFPSLDELSTDYNSSDHQIYQLGYVIGEFIIVTWGKNDFIGLILTNGNLEVYLRIGEKEFENQMYAYITATYLSLPRSGL